MKANQAILPIAAAFILLIALAACGGGDPVVTPASPAPAATPATAPAVSPAASPAPVADPAPDPAVKPAPAGPTSKLGAPTLIISVSGLGRFDMTGFLYPPIPSEGSFDDYKAWMAAHTPDDPKYLKLRWDRLLKDLSWSPTGIASMQRAFLLTPREEFVRAYNLGAVYDHAALPIEDGQTISGPHLVARMTHNLDPRPGMKVLEIGTGSGYQSALLSFMTEQVFTIEIKPNLFGITDGIFRRLEPKYPTFRNIRRMNADGYYGWADEAPFDRIIVTCGIDHIPPELLKQLKPEGIMVIPIGPMTGEQVILKITKHVAEDGTITLERKDIYGGKVVQAFVPFTASDGSWHKEKR